MEESLLKSNFIGRDGFRWWIGQVAPKEVQEQLNKDGWGNRLKVRIMGYHPYNVVELPNKDLPWAQVLLSTSDGTGAANYGTSHKVRPGDIVFGFFLDGDNAQVPVILVALEEQVRFRVKIMPDLLYHLPDIQTESQTMVQE